MVADAIHAMTGTDIAAPLRGYSSRAEALAKIAIFAERFRPNHPGNESTNSHSQEEGKHRDFGNGNPIHDGIVALAQANAMTEIPMTHAKRGDMALIPRARDFSMGIVSLNGSRLTIAMRRGVAEVPLDRACRAWRV